MANRKFTEAKAAADASDGGLGYQITGEEVIPLVTNGGDSSPAYDDYAATVNDFTGYGNTYAKFVDENEFYRWYGGGTAVPAIAAGRLSVDLEDSTNAVIRPALTHTVDQNQLSQSTIVPMQATRPMNYTEMNLRIGDNSQAVNKPNEIEFGFYSPKGVLFHTEQVAIDVDTVVNTMLNFAVNIDIPHTRFLMSIQAYDNTDTVGGGFRVRRLICGAYESVNIVPGTSQSTEDAGNGTEIVAMCWASAAGWTGNPDNRYYNGAPAQIPSLSTMPTQDGWPIPMTEIKGLNIITST